MDYTSKNFPFLKPKEVHIWSAYLPENENCIAYFFLYFQQMRENKLIALNLLLIKNNF